MTFGTAGVQVNMLQLMQYTKGAAQVYLLINVSLWIYAQFNWLLTMKFNESSTEVGGILRGLVMAGTVQILPTVFYLFFFSMFMVDVDNYYAALFPAKRVPHFVLSYYL